MQLSKSRFVSGLQCHRRLWWEIHEPGAPELVPSIALQAQFERGQLVGEEARRFLGAGVLVAGVDEEDRTMKTLDALDSSSRVYEGYLRNGPFVARADVIDNIGSSGFALTEVKASTKVKPEHIPDVAFQVNTAQGAGVRIERAAVMHLNRECRYPDLSNLFLVADVTSDANKELPNVRAAADAQIAMLEGALPPVPPAVDCDGPYPCPFVGRCQLAKPRDHISNVYRLTKKKADQLLLNGWELVGQVPSHISLGVIGDRQRKAAVTGEMIVESSLKAALHFERPLAFLDFETVMPAVPVWAGCRPYDQIPVQMSCHVETRGGYIHHAWLADGPGDPRRAAATAVLEACRSARTILAYNAPFEKTALERLAEGVPELAADLRAVAARVQDLLPVVRENVYHVGFAGSFSIKDVLPVLVPGEGYDDLAVADGNTASALLERMLLRGGAVANGERARLRQDLLDYCKRDTWGMVRLFERLSELAR